MIRRVVYLGTPELAVPSLAALAGAAGLEVALVVTRPDQPAGRGRHVHKPAVKVAAERLGLNVFQPETVNSEAAGAALAEAAPDAMVVVAYGEVLRPEVLAIPAAGCLNMHPSLLPAYRGPAPIHWPILCGETETGVTIIRMDAGVDTGPMLSQMRVALGEQETAGALHDRLAHLGATLLVETIEGLSAGRVAGAPQGDGAGLPRAPKLEKDDGWVDWTAGADAVRDFVRGMTPWPGAFSDLVTGGGRLHVTLTGVRPVERPEGRASGPGEVCRATAHELWVAVGDGGAMAIEALKPAGKRAMTVSEFLCGHDVQEGDRLESPEGTSLRALLARAGCGD
jgi:methionyl-tRNA formyltransferase